MKNGIVFEAVIERLKSAVNVKNDKELAERLGLKPNTYYNRKASRSLPLEEILALASQHELSVDWIFFGIGTAFRTGEGTESRAVAASIDPTLLGQILMTLRDTFFGTASIDSSAETREKLAVICVLAGQIYNEVQYLDDASKRSETIGYLSKMLHRASSALESLS